MPFHLVDSSPALTDIVDTPLPSSMCFPRPSSSPTHKCTLRCSVPHTVSSADSQGYTSLRTDFNRHSPAERNRNNSLLFELCTEFVTYPSEFGERRGKAPFRAHLHAKHAPVVIVFEGGDEYMPTCGDAVWYKGIGPGAQSRAPPPAAVTSDLDPITSPVLGRRAPTRPSEGAHTPILDL